MISTKSGRLGLCSSGWAMQWGSMEGSEPELYTLHKRLETMKSKLAEIKQRLENKTKQEVLHMVQCRCLGVDGKELIHEYFHVILCEFYASSVIPCCSESTLWK